MKERSIRRREFLRTCGISAGIMGCGAWFPAGADAADIMEARFYEMLGDGSVRCHVCPHMCIIDPGKRGLCRTRENRDGRLYTLVYGNVAAEHVDPIEKKPLFHVMPGASVYSIATAGCNMWCKFCQNYQLSQASPGELRTRHYTPADIAANAQNNGAGFIAYTYNEPTVFTEYVHDCAEAGNKRGIHSVVISNGYINPEPLERLADVITAYKVDFKSFSPAFYSNITGGDRDSVLRSIKLLKKAGVWVELVHLTIPTLNDDDDNFTGMAEWLMGEVGPDVPVHFTRFHPMYKLTDLPVTPVDTLERARDIVMDAGMHYVYVGNVPGHPAESTYCPDCGKRIVERGYGYSVGSVNIMDGKCAFCGSRIPGLWAL